MYGIIADVSLDYNIFDLAKGSVKIILQSTPQCTKFRHILISN